VARGPEAQAKILFHDLPDNNDLPMRPSEKEYFKPINISFENFIAGFPLAN
jgi:hypothetical protein